MSAESELRAALVADTTLLGLVPATRISIDAVAQGLTRPYIAFSKQATEVVYGLDGLAQARRTTIDVQVIGSSRSNAIAVRERVEAVLAAIGVPAENVSAGYDPDNDLEAEVVTIDWWN